MNSIWPAVFFGHGNPMNAILRNGYTEAWRAMGAAMGKPRAVLAISAHWFVPEVAVTISRHPERFTILAGSLMSCTGSSIRH
jgi:4,5-DOPA dioxygenase extradiol